MVPESRSLHLHPNELLVEGKDGFARTVAAHRHTSPKYAGPGSGGILYPTAIGRKAAEVIAAQFVRCQVHLQISAAIGLQTKLERTFVRSIELIEGLMIQPYRLVLPKLLIQFRVLHLTYGRNSKICLGIGHAHKR